MVGLSRKTVTVLFSDVVDSTPLGERVDPESVRELMERYFEEMRPVIERHGGTVEKYIGDEIMAVFGIPQVHEDDALRAIRAACEMREALGALNRELPQILRVRTALNTGEVVAGDRHTLVTGDAVNTAARLRTAAAPGEILVGSSTYALVRDAVVAEPLAPLELKGKSAPVGAWRVTAVLPDAPGRARQLDSVLVDRESELPLLRQAYARAVGQRGCHLFTILGTAGVGKSRLAGELLRELSGSARVLVGRCLPYGDGVTYSPLRDVIRAVDLDALVGADDAAGLRGAIGLHTDPTPPTGETFRTLRQLVERVAQDRPVVLAFEDVHWGEPTFLDLIEHLAEWIRDAPVLLLCLARPELVDERPTWGGGQVNATTILLEPLDVDDSEQLVSNLGGDDIAPRLRRTITEIAEGNPLFLEEMVGMIREDGSTSIPPTIQALLTARIERLVPREREVLATASVVGRFFSRDAVEALAGEVDLELESLAQKDLIRPQRVPFGSGDAYRFRHILIRDAAYDALPKQVRSELHARAANWLETTENEVDELVGFHFEQAARLRAELGRSSSELATFAAVPLARAGRRAYARGDASAAVALLQRAVSLGPPHDAAHVERLLDYATALLESGELVTAERVLRDALEHAQALGDRRLETRGIVERTFLAFYAEPQRWVDEALATAEAAIPVLDEHHDEAGLARAWLLELLLHYGRCRIADLERSLEPTLLYARRAGDDRQVSAALTAAVRGLLVGPAPVEHAVVRVAELVATAAGDRSLAAVSMSVVASLDAMRGRFDDARTATAKSRALLGELGRTRLLAAQRAYSGAIEILAGDPVAAEVELRDGMRELERIGDQTNLATVAGLLAQAILLQGRSDEAAVQSEISERLSSTADVASQVAWRLTRARVEVSRARLEDAIVVADEAVALASDTDSPTLQGDAFRCSGEVALAAGRTADAAAAFVAAAAAYDRKGHLVGSRLAADALRQLGVRPSRSATSSSTDGRAEGGT